MPRRVVDVRSAPVDGFFGKVGDAILEAHVRLIAAQLRNELLSQFVGHVRIVLPKPLFVSASS